MAAQMAWLFERGQEMIPGSGFVITDDFKPLESLQVRKAAA